MYMYKYARTPHSNASKYYYTQFWINNDRKNINCPKPYSLEVETTNPYKLPCNGTQKLNHDTVLLNFNIYLYIAAFR